MFNKYTNGCIKIDEDTGLQYLDSIKLRDKKLRTLLKKLAWTNEAGQENDVILNDKFFGNIIPEFGIALLSDFDAQVTDRKFNKMISQGLTLY